MLSHIVIFWTDPANSKAVDDLIAGAERYLKPIPGMLHFHVGRMRPSPRPVVEHSYQVALNTVFASAEAREAYRAHPLHRQFEQEVLHHACVKCLVYDFE